MTRPIVEFQNVSKTYRTGLLRRRAIHALRDVSFKVRGGCVFGLLGPNRAGKTTLVKALLSICRPTSGTILRLGRTWPTAARWPASATCTRARPFRGT